MSLNTSIKWSLDKDCQLLLREVMASSVDPKVLEDTRPNSGQRLPSRFARTEVLRTEMTEVRTALRVTTPASHG